MMMESQRVVGWWEEKWLRCEHHHHRFSHPDRAVIQCVENSAGLRGGL
jgi:hypothetical protein